MGKLTRGTIKALGAKKLRGSEVCIPMAADLLAKAYIRNFKSEWFEEINSEKISLAEVRQLKKKIIMALKRQADPSAIAGLIWALGKTFDKSLIPLYKTTLKKYLPVFLKYNSILHQTNMALDNLGELKKIRRITRAQSMGINQVEQTVNIATQYLKASGIKVSPR
jgi:hypothetical protein